MTTDNIMNSPEFKKPMTVSDAVQLLYRLARKDVREAAVKLEMREVRFLVSMYYIMQENRLRTDSQVRKMAKEDEPNTLLSYISGQNHLLEQVIRNALGDFVMTSKIGKWLKGIYGIGDVIAAGLLAYLDIEKAPTAGHFWAYAGLDPTKSWNRGQKRPWNPAVKRLGWLAGQSFMKFAASEKCFYGKLYKEKKAFYIEKNLSGGFADRAAQLLSTKNYSKGTITHNALESGKLSDGHIDAMARRWAVKIFLSHLQQFWYEEHYGEPAPKPFAIAHLGHAHLIPLPPSYSK